MEAVRIEADLAKAQALEEREHAAQLVVTTPDEYRVAVEALKQATAKHREIEAQRKKATAPLDEAKKQILEWFRPAVDNLTSAIASIRRALATYEGQQRQRESEAAAKYAATPSAETKADLVQAFKGTVESVQGVAKRTIWKFEVADDKVVESAISAIVDAAAGIDRTSPESVRDGLLAILAKTETLAAIAPYLVLDEKRIGAEVRASKGEIVIPGVRAYAETSLAVNGADNE